MRTSYLLATIVVLACASYFLGRSRAFAVSRSCGGVRGLHSLPSHYGMWTALWCALPALLVCAVWNAAESPIITSLVVAGLPADISSLPPNRLSLIINDIRNIISGNITSGTPSPAIMQAAEHYRALQAISVNAMSAVILAIMVAAGIAVRNRISPALKARNKVEKLIQILLFLSSAIAILITVGIVLSVLFEAIRFFKVVHLSDFLFGLSWSPQTAIRSDQVGSSGAFGAVPVFAGTALIALIAMLVAVPIGLMSAIYLSEYAGKRFRTIAKPLLEILAGIPTVVYGFFAALTVAPFIRDTGGLLGLSVSSESALAAGLVMGIMIIPFVSSLSDDVIHAVPQTMRDGSLALGATKYETISNVVVPAALPGIVGGVLLAVSRAIGETMIVVMAAGLSANLTANPLKTVTTVTVQIVTLLVGDQEFDSPKTLAAFALGLLLFVFTLILNIIALYVVRKYREQYE
ncbi:MAG: phosphate ABC transporter permease subunit PstC [Desulfurivibrio sp.]|nr:MAG: phosphate ABC transporter permease subunit PstC [Desulfurivibrio sp.]